MTVADNNNNNNNNGNDRQMIRFYDFGYGLALSAALVRSSWPFGHVARRLLNVGLIGGLRACRPARGPTESWPTRKEPHAVRVATKLSRAPRQ